MPSFAPIRALFVFFCIGTALLALVDGPEDEVVVGSLEAGGVVGKSKAVGRDRSR